uniref:EamA domain-containing protein n=1 Tax=Haptolina ericina TaxID=156174 RepID=A0A7S3BBG1_9EUKA|mmetsp:Transcript_56059/g.125165  ORF Transcript_56059/g.125165 Transcript_56059/m.125165 type:complete len:192 (+) Transcript_56059:2-577(+)
MMSFAAMLLLQNTVGMLPDVIFLFAKGEEKDYPDRFDPTSPDRPPPVAYVMLGLTCVLGLVMGWSMLNAQQYVTATTMMVMGNVNRILIIVGGAILMGESYSWLAIAGIMIAISGSIWYGYTRARVAYGKRKPQFLSVAEGLDKLDPESRSKSGHDVSQYSDGASNDISSDVQSNSNSSDHGGANGASSPR